MCVGGGGGLKSKIWVDFSYVAIGFLKMEANKSGHVGELI